MTKLSKFNYKLTLWELRFKLKTRKLGRRLTLMSRLGSRMRPLLTLIRWGMTSMLWRLQSKTILICWLRSLTSRMCVRWLTSRLTLLMCSRSLTRWRSPFNSWAVQAKEVRALQKCLITSYRSRNSSMRTFALLTVSHSMCGMEASLSDLSLVRALGRQRSSGSPHSLLIHRKEPPLLFNPRARRTPKPSSGQRNPSTRLQPP